MEVTFDKILKESLKSFRGDRVGGIFGVLYKKDANDPGTFIEYKPENYDALRALARHLQQEGGTSQLKVRVAPGLYSDIPPPALEQKFSGADASWNSYLGQVKTDTVETEEIFQLDFNEFLKAKGSLRPLYQKTSALGE